MERAWIWACGSAMKRTVIFSYFGFLSPVYSGLAVRVMYWSALRSVIVYAPSLRVLWASVGMSE